MALHDIRSSKAPQSRAYELDPDIALHGAYDNIPNHHRHMYDVMAMQEHFDCDYYLTSGIIKPSLTSLYHFIA